MSSPWTLLSADSSPELELEIFAGTKLSVVRAVFFSVLTGETSRVALSAGRFCALRFGLVRWRAPLAMGRERDGSPSEIIVSATTVLVSATNASFSLSVDDTDASIGCRPFVALLGLCDVVARRRPPVARLREREDTFFSTGEFCATLTP